MNIGQKQKKRQLDDIEREILSELKKGSSEIAPPPPVRSDQEILLLSFLPYIRDMEETELMDFQMEVLKTILEIKQRRVSNQPQFHQQLMIHPPHIQQQHVSTPQPSPAMSHSSYQSSLQCFEYQSSPSNQSELDQQEQSSNYIYEELFDETAS